MVYAEMEYGHRGVTLQMGEGGEEVIEAKEGYTYELGVFVDRNDAIGLIQ